MGLPASSDVAVLIKMIKKLGALLSASEPHLALVSVVISYPGLVALCEEDIVDAAEYHHIVPAKGLYRYQPREIYAAYAGHGMGLCESYTDREKCRAEGLKMPGRSVLLAEYTQHSLLLHARGMREAMDRLFTYKDVAASFDLGSNNAGVDGHAERVKAFVLEYLRSTYPLLGPPNDPFGGPPKEIMAIMMGNPDAVGDTAIQKAIEDAVEELGSAVNNMITDMPEYVASRGAAELAWRALSLSHAKEKGTV
jgi:hypothetical protein